MGKNPKVIIFSAPSGSGKSTIINRLIEQFPQMEFSISATSRQPRGEEQHGKEYYFFTKEEFKQRIDNEEFIEWEEVYGGSYYGTLKSEIERINSKGNIILFDVDVKGGINLKRIFGENALSFFIKVPSIDILKERLINRGTDTMEAIEKRIAKAEIELLDADKFDVILVNDILDECIARATKSVNDFIG